MSAAWVIALKKLVFFGDIKDKEKASVTFVPSHRVYVYDIFFGSDSSADDARPTGAASFGSPFSVKIIKGIYFILN